MSLIATPSVCGRKDVFLDWFELDYCNPYGPSCCSECDTIIQSRAAWMTPDYCYIP